MSVTKTCLLTLLAATALLLILAPRREITTSIQIAAPPAAVWKILTDTNDYPAWNPQMRLTGQLTPGAVIINQQGLGADAEIFHPTILVAQPNTELRWLGHVGVPGVLDAEHYFRLQPTDGGTLFTQGEKFHGILLWMFNPNELLPGFNAMNAALKTRAEKAP